MKRQRTLHNDKRVNSRRIYTIANIYTLNIETPKYMKQMLMEELKKLDYNLFTPVPRERGRGKNAGDFRPLSKQPNDIC